MTSEQKREYIEARWEYPGLQSLERAGFVKSPTMSKLTMIHAAYEFTLERERQIAEIEEEIDLLEMGISLLKSDDLPIIQRVIAREQAALNDLRRGMKQPAQEDSRERN